MRIVLAWLKREWEMLRYDLLDTLRALFTAYCATVVIGAGICVWLGFALALPLPWGIFTGWIPGLVVSRILLVQAIWVGILSMPLVYVLLTHYVKFQPLF
jgi:hypothetical protein